MSSAKKPEGNAHSSASNATDAVETPVTKKVDFAEKVDFTGSPDTIDYSKTTDKESGKQKGEDGKKEVDSKPPGVVSGQTENGVFVLELGDEGAKGENALPTQAEEPKETV